MDNNRERVEVGILVSTSIIDDVPEEIKKEIILSRLKEAMNKKKVTDYNIVSAIYRFGLVDYENAGYELNRGIFSVEFKGVK